MVKRLPAMRETQVWSLGQEDPLEKEMATHSSILACKIPWTEEPSGLQSMGSQRIGHNLMLSFFLSFFSGRMKWGPVYSVCHIEGFPSTPGQGTVPNGPQVIWASVSPLVIKRQWPLAQQVAVRIIGNMHLNFLAPSGPPVRRSLHKVDGPWASRAG